MGQIVLYWWAQITPEVDLQKLCIRIFWNLTEIKAAFPTTRGDSMDSKPSPLSSAVPFGPVRPASGQRGMIFYQAAGE